MAKTTKTAEAVAAPAAEPVDHEIQVTEEVRFAELALILRPGKTYTVTDTILRDPRLAGKIKE